MKYNLLSTIRQVLISLTFLILISCSEDSTPTKTYDIDKPSNNSINITWDNSTVVFSDNENSDLISIDTLNKIYYFKSSNAKAKSLAIGDNFVMHQYEYFKVEDIQENGDELAVTVGMVPMTEVVSDADISWDQKVSFEKEAIMKAIIATKGSRITVSTFDSVGYSVKVGSYEYSIAYKAKQGSVKIYIIAEKVISDIKVARLNVEGEIRNFRTKGMVKIRDHELSNFNSRNEYMEGDFDVKVAAAGSGNDLGIEVPLPLLKIPIAGIPILWLDVKCLIVMNAILPPGASSLLDYKFKFVVDEGFDFDYANKKCAPNANVRSYEFKNTKQPQSGAPGDMAMSWGLAVPRFELNLGVPEIYNTTVGWVHSAYLIGGDYTFLPACQQSKASFIGAYGWALGGFGISLASGSGNLWNYNKVFLKVGDCK